MVFLSLARVSRTKRMIPNSLEHLLANEYMLENLIKEIHGFCPGQINRMKVRKETQGTMQGHLSDSGRVVVKLEMVDGSTHQVSWFVKIKPQYDNTSDQDFDVFRNEIDFYQKILPEMKNLLVTEGFGDEHIDFDIPSILYAKEEAGAAIIVLEDIYADGYRHIKDCNGEKYLDVEQAMVAVRSIARIHAASVAIQEKNNVDLAVEYPSLAESELLWTQAEMAARLTVMKDNYCNLLKKSTETDSPKLLRRFQETFDSAERLVELCERRIKPNNNHGSLSLQHGDFHFNNLMFKVVCGRMKVKMVDWQLTYCGKATGDLSYLLLSSLSPRTRELHEDQIKAEYFASYLGILETLSQTGLCKALLDLEYTDSLQLSFFLSCGNIMAVDNQNNQDRCVKFSYDMCKEAVQKEII